MRKMKRIKNYKYNYRKSATKNVNYEKTSACNLKEYKSVKIVLIILHWLAY